MIRTQLSRLRRPSRTGAVMGAVALALLMGEPRRRRSPLDVRGDLRLPQHPGPAGGGSEVFFANNDGAVDISSTPARLVSLPLPPGAYVVEAQVGFFTQIAGKTVGGNCNILHSGDFQRVATGSTGPEDHVNQVITFTAAFENTGDVIELFCESGLRNEGLFATRASLLATKVASVTLGQTQNFPGGGV